MDEYLKIGERIKQLRVAKDLTLDQVGQYIGVNRSTVQRWESGNIQNMRRDKIAKLADILGTDPGYILGGDRPDPSDELTAILEDARRDPDKRLMFKLAKTATPEQIKAAIAVMQALKGEKE